MVITIYQKHCWGKIGSRRRVLRGKLNTRNPFDNDAFTQDVNSLLANFPEVPVKQCRACEDVF